MYELQLLTLTVRCIPELTFYYECRDETTNSFYFFSPITMNVKPCITVTFIG